MAQLLVWQNHADLICCRLHFEKSNSEQYVLFMVIGPSQARKNLPVSRVQRSSLTRGRSYFVRENGDRSAIFKVHFKNEIKIVPKPMPIRGSAWEFLRYGDPSSMWMKETETAFHPT